MTLILGSGSRVAAVVLAAAMLGGCAWSAQGSGSLTSTVMPGSLGGAGCRVSPSGALRSSVRPGCGVRPRTVSFKALRRDGCCRTGLTRSSLSGFQASVIWRSGSSARTVSVARSTGALSFAPPATMTGPATSGDWACRSASPAAGNWSCYGEAPSLRRWVSTCIEPEEEAASDPRSRRSEAAFTRRRFWDGIPTSRASRSASDRLARPPRRASARSRGHRPTWSVPRA